MSWQRATNLDELTRRGALVFKHGRHQLAIIHAGGRCHAIDNRCPHEGYPLSQGTVDERCVLTCNWHNWKFELDTGRNLTDGDSVRTYPVELRDGEVWVDLTDPPPEQQRAAALAGLREAFDDRDHAFMARQLARLAAAGFDPADEALPLAIGWCAPRLEYGMTHAIPTVADWLEFHDGLPDADREARLVTICEALEHMAHDGLRELERAFPDGFDLGAGGFDEAAFLREVEAEDSVAIARVRAALRAGVDFAALEGTLVRAALSHYADFGHALIYVGMVGRLIARLGERVAEPALSALVRRFIHVTREDLIPEFRPLGEAVANFPTDAVLDGPAIGDDDVEALLGCSLKAAFAWVHGHARSHGLRACWDALMRASALSMLRFELAWASAVDIKVDDNVDWLDFTHALTFGSAVREQAGRYGWAWAPGLLQMACFVARNRKYRAASGGLGEWRVDDAEALFGRIDARLLDHDMPLPIYPAHVLKTRRAVSRELGHVEARTRDAMLAALNRFVSSPIRQRHARRNVHQALVLVGG